MGHTNGLRGMDHGRMLIGTKIRGFFPIDLIIHIARSERSLDETSNLELDQLLVETS
jgi:hypothetical protein